MCGISGIVTRDPLSPELRAAVSRMSSAQTHRGPDGSGDFQAANISLASRRLSIIDQSGGSQPLFNEDKSLALIVNGEIYNYIELRKSLEVSGHKFRTDSDSEVILHLYEENQLDFVDHLRGMFALALWDNKRGRLILARDRMGEKPLYLYERDGMFLFASEMKSLLLSRLFPFELNPVSVNLYFHYQYVPEPFTAVKKVRKLDAAKLLVVDVAAWRIEEKIYWRMEDAKKIEGEPDVLIREMLNEVSEVVIRSDVPVGVALSGGLDSSAVAAFAARKNSDLCAFSVGYVGRPSSDERRDAELFAKYLKIPIFDVEIDTDWVVDFFPELNFWRDDPIADISGFGYYSVAKLAREHGVPVLLQGQGGDELFWGYPQLREALSETLKKSALLNNPFAQTLRQSLTLGLPIDFTRTEMLNWISDFGGVRTGLRNVRRRRKDPDRLVFYDRSPDFTEASSRTGPLYGSAFEQEIYENPAYSFFAFPDDCSPSSLEIALTSLICSTYLRCNGIAQADRLGMASSVETRLPLADHKLVETIIGLRKAYSDSSLPPKQWLKDAVKDTLPSWVLDRPKRGFAPPTREWHDAIFCAYSDTLRYGYLVESGILSPIGAAKLALGEFPDSSTCPLSFKALVLETWCRQMLDING